MRSSLRLFLAASVTVAGMSIAGCMIEDWARGFATS